VTINFSGCWSTDHEDAANLGTRADWSPSTCRPRHGQRERVWCRLRRHLLPWKQKPYLWMELPSGTKPGNRKSWIRLLLKLM
jgi:hypothetical protein